MQRAKTFLYVCTGLLCLVTAHGSAASDPLELNSGIIAPGGVYEHTFTASGTYPYYCVIHGPGMQGAVSVVGGGPQSASVVIVANAFNPSSVTVAPGGTVVWTNASAASHTVTSPTPTPTKPATWGHIKALYR